jgi:hypothetical protein
MKKLQLRLAKYLLKRLGYNYVAIKQTTITNRYGEKVIKHNAFAEVPTLFIEGDRELLMYTDIVGFTSKKEPLRRSYDTPEFPWPTPINKLPPDVLAEIELTTIPFSDEIKKQNETID